MATLLDTKADLPATRTVERRDWLVVVRDFTVPLVGGIMLGLPFYSERFSWLAWIALVPIAWVLCKPRATVSLYVGSFYGGLAFSLLGLDWIRESYHGNHIDSWIVIGHLLALFWIGAVWAGRHIMQATRLPAVIVLPTFWVAMEWLRWHIAGIPVEDGFPLLQLGTTQAEHDRLIQIADLGGIAAVTGLVAATNGAVFDVACKVFGVFPNRRLVLRTTFSLFMAAILIAAAWIYGEWRLRAPRGEAGPTVGIVSSRIGINATEDAAQNLRRSIRDRLAFADVAKIEPRFRPGYTDLLIWRETALSGFSIVDPTTIRKSADSVTSHPNGRSIDEMSEESAAGLERLHAFSRQVGSSLIIGAKRWEHGDSHDRKYNSVVHIDGSNDGLEYYDKIHLAPSREIRPQLASLLGIVPPKRAINVHKTPMQCGDDQRTFALSSGSASYRFAATICYDLFFPAEQRRLINGTDDGAEMAFFVGAASERGVRETTFPRLSLALQRFRAIECRRSYARNAGFGISAIVDSRGRPVPTIHVDAGKEGTILIGRVPISRGRSIYVRLGEWLPTLACVLCGLILAVSVCRSSDSAQ